VARSNFAFKLEELALKYLTVKPGNSEVGSSTRVDTIHIHVREGEDK
jgi:hypothetical protein